MLAARRIKYTLNSCLKFFRREAIQAEVIWIDTLPSKKTFALHVGLDDLAQSIEIAELVRIENIIDENNFFLQRNGDVHSHCNAGHDKLAMLDERDKLLDMEKANILCAAICSAADLAIASVFIRSAEE